MKVMRGRVVEGKIVVEDGDLRDGESVTIVVHEADGDFELTPEQDALLRESLKQAYAGKTVSAADVLRDAEQIGSSPSTDMGRDASPRA